MADTRTYSWHRYWRPIKPKDIESEGDFRLRQFLQDWEISSPRHTDAVPFQAIETIPCLVLLGEPGIGKSTGLRSEIDRIGQNASSELILDLNLKQYGSEPELLAATFRSESFNEWKEMGRILHVFLDSLDECQLSIRNVAEILKRELRALSNTDGLYFRIVCRTADWPESLGAELKRLWGDDSFAMYELSPLRPHDIRAAAQSEGINPEAFWNELEEIGVIPLATKPINLLPLIDAYLADRTLPASQVELYRQSCLRLCEESSESRHEARYSGEYSEHDRLKAASAIAAALIFGGLPAIRLRAKRTRAPSTDLIATELTNYQIKDFKLQKRLLEETLNTGLFSAYDSGRLGWAHQTYGEFLAASFVDEHLSDQQIMSLITHPDDPDGRLVPQLYETAAWIASMRPTIFAAIVGREPEILLKSDMVDQSPEAKAALTESLLQLYNDRKRVERRRNYGLYRKLEHPDLVAQLRPYILEKDKNFFARREAFDIATACKLTELQHELFSVALDSSEHYYLRVFALAAFVNVADIDSLAKAKVFALEQAGEDPDDELKGIALSVLWPEHLSATELFAALTDRKKDFLLGNYWRFLDSNPIHQLDVSDLPTALNWIAEQSYRRLPRHSDLEKLYNAIFWKAWSSFSVPGVLDSFVGAAVSRLAQYEPIVDEQDGWGKLPNQYESSFEYAIRHDHDKRRQLLLSALTNFQSPQLTSRLVSSATPLCTSDDFSWLLEHYTDATWESLHPRLLELAQYVIDPNNVEHVGLVRRLQAASPVLYQQLEEQLTREASRRESQRRQHENNERTRVSEREARLAQVDNALEIAIGRISSGDHRGWLSLYWADLGDPRNHQMPYDVRRFDLTKTYAWEHSDHDTRVQFVTGAVRYLAEYELNLENGENDLEDRSVQGYAGIAAFCLILKLGIGSAEVLPVEIWRKWAPIVVHNTLSSGEPEEVLRPLITGSYEHAPEQTIDAMVQILTDDRLSLPSNIRLFDYCWDDRIANTLLRLASEYQLGRSALHVVLRYLTRREVPGADLYAKSLINPPFPNHDALERGVVAAYSLMQHSLDGGWGTVWPALQSDEQFAEAVLERVASYPGNRTHSLGSQLAERELGDLYEWLAKRYPSREELPSAGAFSESSEGSIARWRDAIPHLLSNKGTWQAVEVLRWMHQEFPESNELIHVLMLAQEHVLRKTWRTIHPDIVFALANNEHGRFVRNGDELLDVITASLTELVTRLQGETPLARTLWNEPRGRQDPNQSYVPKDEQALSDVIKDHLDKSLKARGIVVNREVEISRRTGEYSGARTDIHVDARLRVPNQEEYQVLKAIIEVKGIWEFKLFDCMKSQLVEKYLEKTDCKHGLYVVGWFNCPQWDTTDPRYKRANVRRRRNIDRIQRRLNRGASKLSRGDISVQAFILDASLPH